MEDADHHLDVSIRKQEVGPRRGAISVRRLEQAPRFHDPVGGELVDDHGHETHLVDREARAVEVPGEGLGCGVAVEAYEGTDEETEPAGLLGRPGDVDRPPAGGHQHLLQRGKVVPRERLSDTPSFLDFPGEHSHVRYSEGIYVGYRYYDARSIAVDYPFGYGLSYTTFEYSDPVVTTFDVDDPLAFTADITVTNTGSLAGAEVVQLYVSDHAKTVTTPPQELRGFTKIYLQAGQSERARLTVPRNDLEHFSIAARSWVYEGGPVTVMIGSSSRDIRATVDVEIPGRPVALPLTVWSTFREWREHPTVGPQLEKLLAARGGIRGRMADLLSDETGQDSVLDVPMQSLLEFPGVPLTADDAQRLVTETA